MTMLVLYLVRTLEPPPVNAWVDVYGLTGDATATHGQVRHVDSEGITVEIDSSTFGTRVWHFELPQVK